MKVVKAYAAKSATTPLAPFEIKRRSCSLEDVEIEILYCGVCHSDLHSARNDWGATTYPIVPGHEIVGRVKAIGNNVTNFQVGDIVGVGCMVGSCGKCSSCSDGLEQYCDQGLVGTYGGEDKILGGHNFGGYSKEIIVDKKFVLRIPTNLDLKAAAPLLCAGITMWSPLKHWGVKANDTVGIIGLGGLGHMGVKLASAMGAKVVMITTSAQKGEDAKRLGASEVIISKDLVEMEKWAEKFDLLINTIPVGHDFNPYLNLLKRDKTMVLVGAIELLEQMHGGLLIRRRRSVAGSLIGGIKETQEMLDFCGKHNVTCDVEMIAMSDINEAYNRMIKNDVKYRFVIDMASL